jgi:hypothetical protein
MGYMYVGKNQLELGYTTKYDYQDQGGYLNPLGTKNNVLPLGFARVNFNWTERI